MSEAPYLFGVYPPRDRTKVASVRLLARDGTETVIEIDEHATTLAMRDLAQYLMSFKFRQVPRA